MSARRRLLGLLFTAAFGAGCSEQSITVELRSLSASGDVSYVCRDTNDRGVPLSECSAGGLWSGRNDLYALVTQTSTGEVAVINVPYDMDNRDDDEGVVDLDPSSPGYGFLRVGAQPVDIVSMPAGQATFVASAEPGRPGIYALPTSCIDEPGVGEAPRDLTTWPACSLRAAPGGISLIKGKCLDGERAIANTCEHELGETDENGGCTKLVISQPDRGSLLVVDALSLLDRPQGSFVDCEDLPGSEAHPLSVSLPAAPLPAKLPEDLATGCPPVPPPMAPPGPVSTARPARLETSGSTLYVADQEAPVIHVVEMGSDGRLREAPPLLPQSYWAPQRRVTASRLAVSPLTPSGKRWLYAIDELDTPTGSLMAFDVSPGSTERTPHLRERSTLVPDQPPDRVTFPAAVRDVTFVMRDRPEFDDSGLALLGELCEPDPSKSNDPGALYRPDVDRETGARPSKLRGLFAIAMLSDGLVSVIDVEDFDAACRRPIAANLTDTEDDRGCPPDPKDRQDLADFGYRDGGIATVTNEVSCRMVEPHRPRSSRLAINNSNTAGGPSLRALPSLNVPSAARFEDAETRPKLLAVEGVQSVWVGATQYVPVGTDNRAAVFDINPATAGSHAVALPYTDIRAYRGNEELTLMFEGPITPVYSTGLLQRSADGGLVLGDANARYCDAGVSDRELMEDLAARRFGNQAPEELRRFGESFSDHIVITADFPPEDDPYWPHRTEVVPGDPSTELMCTRDSCEAYFGELPDTLNVAELDETRQFEIVDVEQQRLVLEQRFYTQRRASAAPAEVAALDSERNRQLAMAECCFPESSSYQVRASRHWSLVSSTWGFRHDVIPNTETEGGRTVIECRRDCDPRKKAFESRVFEIATEECTPREGSPCQLNACTTPTRRAVQAADAAWACVHDTPTARFALYQGVSPSYRGMYFRWQVMSGFTALQFNLTTLANFVSPQAVVNLPDLDRLTIVDASTLGLTMISLDGLRPLIPTLN